ncbi:hypothetical protein R3P38DRAFT_2797086 [Favolaschia claudopus]|uniref:Uncharacterized protein n=1 Tax=Favolaschia claudopus TaxID=2862362 RepID=A0AAW0A337_9AGAR
MEIVQLGPKAWPEWKRLKRTIRLHHQPSSLRSPDIPGLVKHCVRGHTQGTRQHRSTDVKVWDNTTTRMLRFGKETADQAIQQGNAQEVTDDRGNRRTYSGVQHDGQQYITKFNSRRSTLGIVCQRRTQTAGIRRRVQKASYLTRESVDGFRGKGPQIHGNPLRSCEKALSNWWNPLRSWKNPTRTAGIHCEVDICPPKSPESTAQLEKPHPNGGNPLRNSQPTEQPNKEL